MNSMTMTERLVNDAIDFINATNRTRGQLNDRTLFEEVVFYVHQTQRSSDLKQARIIAAKAICRWESRGIHKYIDADRTTSDCLVIRDELTNKSTYYSIKDIVSLVDSHSNRDMPSDAYLTAKLAARTTQSAH